MKTKIVYLIHFNKPYKHAKHYLGSTNNLNERIKLHLQGKGARLLQVVINEGISFEVVRTQKGDKKYERKLKKLKNSCRLCPICKNKFK